MAIYYKYYGSLVNQLVLHEMGHCGDWVSEVHVYVYYISNVACTDVGLLCLNSEITVTIK